MSGNSNCILPKVQAERALSLLFERNRELRIPEFIGALDWDERVAHDTMEQLAKEGLVVTRRAPLRENSLGEQMVYKISDEGIDLLDAARLKLSSWPTKEERPRRTSTNRTR